jgi:hypothetical protein
MAGCWVSSADAMASRLAFFWFVDKLRKSRVAALAAVALVINSEDVVGMMFSALL